MPNRWIKEVYKSSDRINSVGPAARDLWVRLLVTCDDYGRYPANPQLVASACYPLEPSASTCEKLLAELVAARLVTVYEADGKPYFEVEQWYERPRSRSKFPPNPRGSNDGAPLTTDGNCAQLRAPTNTTTTTTTNTEPRKQAQMARKCPLPPDFKMSDNVKKWARQKGYDSLPERFEDFVSRVRAHGYQYADWDAAFMKAIREDWAKLGKAELPWH